MSYVKQMFKLPTSRFQQLLELAILAAVAFSLGLRANSIGGGALIRANDQDAHLAVAAETENRPAIAARSQAAMVRVPYEAGWQLYDNGWAGGASTVPETRSALTLMRELYELGLQLYNNGWAGGPRRATAGQTHN